MARRFTEMETFDALIPASVVSAPIAGIAAVMAFFVFSLISFLRKRRS